MAVNKNALIRYKTIDKCLQNHYRKWTLNDLIQACSDALYEFEGRMVNVSKRTIQLDIQTMRSDKLGYNAPIVVFDKKYYKYEDPGFTITDIPLNDNDMQVLSETIEMLKQFKDFSFFDELGGIVEKLEDKIHTEKHDQPAIIHLEKNENLKGLHYLNTIYQAILKNIVLKITYQSFKSRKPSISDFHGYLLKEFNNRWFVVGKREDSPQIISLALDRIQNIELNLKLEYQRGSFDANQYYKNTYGVTVLRKQDIKNIVLRIDRQNAPYVLTKPFHHSQELKEKLDDGSILIQLSVHTNLELERLILGFGAHIEVIKPASLRRRIHYQLKKAYEQYSVSL